MSEVRQSPHLLILFDCREALKTKLLKLIKFEFKKVNYDLHRE